MKMNYKFEIFESDAVVEARTLMPFQIEVEFATFRQYSELGTRRNKH